MVVQGLVRRARSSSMRVPRPHMGRDKGSCQTRDSGVIKASLLGGGAALRAHGGTHGRGSGARALTRASRVRLGEWPGNELLFWECRQRGVRSRPHGLGRVGPSRHHVPPRRPPGLRLRTAPAEGPLRGLSQSPAARAPRGARALPLLWVPTVFCRTRSHCPLFLLGSPRPWAGVAAGSSPGPGNPRSPFSVRPASVVSAAAAAV